MHLPSWKTTYKYVKRLGDLVTFGKIAKISGKDVSVAEAWGRPFESDEFPAGTGKRDPSQTILRLIGLAHEHDAGLAREWAESFRDYVDFLDGRTGAVGSICELVGENAKEQMDIVLLCLHSKNPDMKQIHTEAMQARAKLNSLIACIKQELRDVE